MKKGKNWINGEAQIVKCTQSQDLKRTERVEKSPRVSMPCPWVPGHPGAGCLRNMIQSFKLLAHLP